MGVVEFTNPLWLPICLPFVDGVLLLACLSCLSAIVLVMEKTEKRWSESMSEVVRWSVLESGRFCKVKPNECLRAKRIHKDLSVQRSVWLDVQKLCWLWLLQRGRAGVAGSKLNLNRHCKRVSLKFFIHFSCKFLVLYLIFATIRLSLGWGFSVLDEGNQATVLGRTSR